MCKCKSNCQKALRSRCIVSLRCTQVERGVSSGVVTTPCMTYRCCCVCSVLVCITHFPWVSVVIDPPAVGVVILPGPLGRVDGHAHVVVAPPEDGLFKVTEYRQELALSLLYLLRVIPKVDGISKPAKVHIKLVLRGTAVCSVQQNRLDPASWNPLA